MMASVQKCSTPAGAMPPIQWGTREGCCRAYNDWMIEFCSVAPQRFWGLALISLWNIEHAVKELERCRKARLRGAAIGLVPAEELLYGSDHYERFWAACQDLAMSVNMHINSGPGRLKFSPQQRSGLMPDGAAGHKWDCMKAVGIVPRGSWSATPVLTLCSRRPAWVGYRSSPRSSTTTK